MYYSIMCSVSPKTTQASTHVPRSPGVVGFSNDSFNCYANAAIQALANCPPLIQLLKEEETRKAGDGEQSGKLPEKFRQIILDIWSEKRNASINPEELIEALRARTKLFQKGFQHDSQEFIHFLMLLMNEKTKEENADETSPKRFLRKDSGLGSLHAISQCSSNEEDEDNEKDEDGRRTEKQEADARCSAEAGRGLERRDSGLELGSVMKKQAQNNLASIFESVIEITTRCHACNKDSCVREVSETIRVPILSKATKSGAVDTPRVSVATEPLPATDSPPDTIITSPEEAPGSDDVSPDKADSLPQEVTAGQTLENDSSSAETGVKPEEASVVESDGKDRQEASSDAINEQSRSEIVKSNDAIGQERHNLMQCVRSFGNFLCVAFCRPANSSSSSASYEQLNERNANLTSGSQLTLDACIDEMLQAETMDGENKYNCETCKQLTSASRKVKLLKLSEVLIFQLMRFTYEHGKVSKVQDRVQFPAVIDMTKHLPESSVGTEDNGTRESSYELVAVICHHGSSTGGHYTTFAKNDASKLWHYFDDTRIAVVSFETVLRQQAYILFYKRL